MIICRHKRYRQEKRRTRIAILANLINTGREKPRGTFNASCA